MPQAINSKKCPLCHPLCKPSDRCVKCLSDEIKLLSAHLAKISNFLARTVSVRSADNCRAAIHT